MKFKINTAKTKLMTPGNRQTVTGIVVNEKTASRVSQT
jgi:RNA-directed DNA polymerase